MKNGSHRIKKIHDWTGDNSFALDFLTERHE